MRARLLPVLMLCAASASFAQVGASNPAVAAQRAIPSQSQLERTRSLAPRPQPMSGVVAPATAPQAEDPGAAAQKLTVTRIAFTGVTVLGAAELTAMARPYTGRLVSFRELQQLSAAIEARYRRLGFLAARVLIPTQKVVGGVVQISVFEGRYGQITVRGNKQYSERFIRRFFGFAKPGTLVRQRPLLSTLLVLREFPHLGIRSALEPGRAPGTTDLSLEVIEGNSFHIGYEYNNFGIRLVGRNRASIDISGSDAFTDGDELSVRYTELFPAKSDPVYQGSYLVPVFDHGDRLGLQYLRSKTRVGGAFEALDLRGDVEIASLSYSRPLHRDLRTANSLAATFSVKTVKSFVFGDALTSQDDLRVFSGAYSHAETRTRTRAFSQATVSEGLGSFLGGRPNGDPIASRVGTGDDFTKLNLDHVRYHQLDAKNSLLVRFSGQLSDRALTVAELFSLGGADSVRGFTQSELLGDEGYFLSAEVRHRFYEKRALRMEGALFLDDGHASLLRPQPGEDGSRHVTGAGAGLRAGLGTWGTLRLEVGFPISQARTAEGDDMLLYAQHAARF